MIVRELERLTMDDLNEDQREVAELVGLEQYKALIAVFGGVNIYIPKPDSFVRSARDERIRDEYDGYNVKALALKYDLSEAQVRNILANIIKELRAKPNDGQTSLFVSPA